MTLDAPARVVPPGRTVVPLRFVSESLGAEVEWLPKARLLEMAGLLQEVSAGVEKELGNPSVQRLHALCREAGVPEYCRSATSVTPTRPSCSGRESTRRWCRGGWATRACR